MAFCGMPEPSVDICIGAFPAATFRTVKEKKESWIILEKYCFVHMITEIRDAFDLKNKLSIFNWPCRRCNSTRQRRDRVTFCHGVGRNCSRSTVVDCSRQHVRKFRSDWTRRGEREKWKFNLEDFNRQHVHEMLVVLDSNGELWSNEFEYQRVNRSSFYTKEGKNSIWSRKWCNHIHLSSVLRYRECLRCVIEARKTEKAEKKEY